MTLPLTPLVSSFAGGELSPLLDGRVDFQKYHTGCRRLRNAVALAHGPAHRRSGTRFVAAVADSAVVGRLLPFEFSDEQAYILEFGALTMRVFKDKGQVVSGGAPYAIVTPFAEADLPRLQTEQSADVLFIASGMRPPQRLSRTGHTAWTIEACPVEDGPYLDENTTATTVTASAATGTGITLTASAPLFAAGHVGAPWRFNEEGASKHDKWVPATAYAAGARVWYDGRVYETTAGGTSGTRSPLHEEGTESDGAVDWTWLHSGFGYVTVTEFTDSTHVKADVAARLPDSATAGTKRWQEGAWSDHRGWPRAVAIHGERLIWAGTRHQPATVWGSRVGDYYRHTPGTKDDDAFASTLGGGKVNVIRWLSGGTWLLAGTSGGPWRAITPGDEPLTPTNVSWREQVAHGCAGIAPAAAGKAQLYVQAKGRKVLELVYSLEADGLVAPDLTILAEHLTAGGFTALAWQEEPHRILWAARADGTLLGLTYMRDQDVIAWHQHPTADGDVVESIATIPGPGGDQLWVIAARQVGGVTTRYVEVLEDFFGLDTDQEDAFFVDSGLTYAGAATASVSGLDHLEGRTVQVLVDGGTHPDRVVSAGAVSLDREGATIHVGLPYRTIVEAMPLEPAGHRGTGLTKTKRIARAAVRLYRSLECRIGRDDDHLDTLDFREVAHPMGAPPPLYTGDKVVSFPGTYDTRASVVIVQDAPLPLTVVCVVPRLGLDEG